MYETFIDPIIGLAIFLVLNIAVVIVSINIDSRLGKWSWLAHIAVLLFLICSPVLMMELSFPKMSEGEEPGMGDGLIVLPLLLEVILVTILYLLFLIRKAWRQFRRSNSIQILV